VHDRDREKTKTANESDEGRLCRSSASEYLRNSSTHLRLIVENSPDLIATLDPDATIRFMNHTLPQFTVEEVLGTSAFDYVHAADRERYKKTFQEVLATGEPREMELVSEGPACWLSRFVPVCGDDGAVSVLVIATDITERKQAEEERRRLRRRCSSAKAREPQGARRRDRARFQQPAHGNPGSAQHSRR
jgi:PAS domain S-box-containing protein